MTVGGGGRAGGGGGGASGGVCMGAQPAHSSGTATQASRDWKKRSVRNMRQVDSEMGAFGRGGWWHQFDAPAMCLDVFTHDGQADACAPHGAFGLVLAPVKRFEDACDVARGHTGPLVDDVDAHHAA